MKISWIVHYELYSIRDHFSEKTGLDFLVVLPNLKNDVFTFHMLKIPNNKMEKVRFIFILEAIW